MRSNRIFLSRVLCATFLTAFSLSTPSFAKQKVDYDSEETDESYIPDPSPADDVLMPRQVTLTEQQKLSLEQARIGQGLGQLPSRRMDGRGGIIYGAPVAPASPSAITAPMKASPAPAGAVTYDAGATSSTPQTSEAPQALPQDVRNCFAPQGVDEDTALAVVQLVQHLPHGITTGTGFIVADSADATTKENRIVTAKHVLNESYRTSVVLSDGTLIGSAAPTSSTKRVVMRDSDGAIFGKNDLAVLEMTSFMPDQDIKYHDIKGIVLAKTRPSKVMEGYFSTPGGIERGASGSPVLNSQNEAIGVVTQSFINDAVGAPRVSATGWNGKWDATKREFSFHPEQVSLPVRTRVVVDTLGAQSILTSLGAAGLRYDFGDFSGDARIIGYPQRTCVVYHGHLKSL